MNEKRILLLERRRDFSPSSVRSAAPSKQEPGGHALLWPAFIALVLGAHPSASWVAACGSAVFVGQQWWDIALSLAATSG